MSTLSQSPRRQVASVLEAFNRWRRGEDEMPNPRDLGRAIDSAVAMLRAVPDRSIANSIRASALSWPPEFLGDVECTILHTAFLELPDYTLWLKDITGVQGRVFMLLVAHALEE